MNKANNSITLQFKVLLNMKSKLRLFLVFLAFTSIMSSCKIFNPSVMLRTKKDYPYTAGMDTTARDHIINKGDIITFRLFSNQGFKIIDLSTMEEGNSGNQRVNVQNTFPYLVEADSSVNLPIIGRIKIAGFDLKEAEKILESKYENYYQEPFVMLQIQNRRVTIFPGRGGDAKVISLTNEYTTIVEALALAGGISEGGKAHKVKVIRGNLNDPEIFNVDLSTPQGLADANMHFVRANDIIYVEPNYFVARQIVTASAQLLALVTNSLATYIIVTNLTN